MAMHRIRQSVSIDVKTEESWSWSEKKWTWKAYVFGTLVLRAGLQGSDEYFKTEAKALANARKRLRAQSEVSQESYFG